MPYTTAGRNLMLDALKGTSPATPITHAGLLAEDAGKSVTAVAATDVFTSNGHGYSAGDVVVFSGLTGGAGLRASVSEVYFVIAPTTNTFQVSRLPGGAALNMTSDLTSGTVKRLVELSGGSPAYARKAIAFNAAADGNLDDSTNGALFDVPGGTTVGWAGYWSALTAGTLLAATDQTDEIFANQGTYTLTDVDLDLNA